MNGREDLGEALVVDAVDARLQANAVVPEQAGGLVVFAHGSGSSRFSARNRAVARFLQRSGLGTVLLDLLSERESEIDRETGEFRFDIDLLGRRLSRVVAWVAEQARFRGLRQGLFGASTGAAAALIAAAERPTEVGAVVSRGGRPDLARSYLGSVRAPTLLIVGGWDEAVLELNRAAEERLRCEHRLRIVPGATHLFEEPGALDQVAELAAAWFLQHLAGKRIRLVDEQPRWGG